MARDANLVAVRRLGRLAAALAMFLLSGTAAAGATDFDSALRGLAQPSAEAVARAVEELGGTGDPRALGILEALRDGDLSVNDSGGVFVHGADPGSEPHHPPAVDNSVRRVLAPLVSRLQLRAPDPAVRLSAVEEIAGRASGDDETALRDALEHEKDKGVRRAITAALAELDLASDDPQRRLGAVRAIESEGSERLRPKLAALAEKRDDGSYVEPDARVRETAASVVRALDRKQFVMSRVADLIYGLSMGSVLLLSSLGLAITFGVMRVINMAHGEMLMLGAYATYETQVVFATHWPEHESWYLLAAVPVALVTTMTAGAVLERTVIRFLYGRPLETLLATYGLSLLLIQTVRSTFGAQNVAVANPSLLSGGFEIFEGVVVPYSRVAVVLFTIAVVSFVGYVLRGTALGLRVRAVTQNRPMAACMGIRTARVDTWTFALGSGVGGLGGVALSQLGNVGPDLGQSYIVDSFLVVVLGGVGKLVGCVFAAMSLGIVNKLLEPLAGAVLGKIVVLLLVVLIIQKRPQGLFAPRGRNVESA